MVDTLSIQINASNDKSRFWKQKHQEHADYPERVRYANDEIYRVSFPCFHGYICKLDNTQKRNGKFFLLQILENLIDCNCFLFSVIKKKTTTKTQIGYWRYCELILVLE